MNKVIRKIAQESGISFGVYTDKDNPNGKEYCGFPSYNHSVSILEEYTKRLLEEYVAMILDDESGDIDYIKWRIRKELLENGNQ